MKGGMCANKTLYLAVSAPRAYVGVMNTFTLLAYVVMAGVLVVLARGIWTLYKTSDEARSRSNTLMRWRVGLQFVAVVLLMAGLWWKNH